MAQAFNSLAEGDKRLLEVICKTLMFLRIVLGGFYKEEEGYYIY